jgi:hypothetical protein
MISNHDRSGWFGASDIDYIVGNWKTKSFLKWWEQKLGLNTSHFSNRSMNAGTNKEHQILEYLGIPYMDKQIKIPSLKLRVNLDGNTVDEIHEVKTYAWEKGFKVPLKYKRQIWVQMYVTGWRKAYIQAYGLKEEDYKNYFLPIDKDRLQTIPIEYNEDFIQNEFLPKIKYLAKCLEEGCLP